MVFSLVLGEMAVGGRSRIIQNAGFWLFGIWGLVTVIFLGSRTVKNELQNKTIYLILSRPVSRSSFLLGKFLGILLVLSFLFFLLGITWFVLLNALSINFTYLHLITILFIFAECVLLSAVSLFFATFTSSLLHNFFLVGIYMTGHLSNDLINYASKVDSAWLKEVLEAAYYILPNLEAFNFRTEALLNLYPPVNIFFQAGAVISLWIVVFLSGAHLIFYNSKIK